MTLLLFKAVYKHFYEFNNCKDQIFCNFEIFFKLKILQPSLHQSICCKSHTKAIKTILLHTRDDEKFKRLLCANLHSLMMD